MRPVEGRRLDGGGEREQEFAGRERGADLLDERGYLDRLDAEQDDVGGTRGGKIVGGDLDGVPRGERDGAVFVSDGGANLLRMEQIVF